MKGIVGGRLAKNGSDYQADCEAEGWCQGQRRIMIEVNEVSRGDVPVRPSSCWGREVEMSGGRLRGVRNGYG